jgi:hypothetical protein
LYVHEFGNFHEGLYYKSNLQIEGDATARRLSTYLYVRFLFNKDGLSLPPQLMMRGASTAVLNRVPAGQPNHTTYIGGGDILPMYLPPINKILN